MANSLKKKTPPPPDPEQLTPDKEATVTVTEVVKDERTSKIVGAIFLLTTIFLFVAFTSYLFTWQEDQDKVHQFGIRIFATNDVHVNNLLGVLGAFIAHVFMNYGFGLAAYLCCTSFFVLGVNLLFAKKIFNFPRNLKYVVTGLLVISMSLSFVTKNSDFSWGGAVGEILTDWFVKWIGNVGTGALLLLTVFCYVIWRFNPVFKLPERKQPKTTDNAAAIAAGLHDETTVFKEWSNEDISVDGAKLLIDDSLAEPVSMNSLKNDAQDVQLNIPEETLQEDHLNEFDLVEKMDEEPAIITELPKPTAAVEVTTAAFAATDLALEINATPVEEIDVAAVVSKPGSLTTKYDATLDLKNYKYPSLDLLDQHGSEKIVHDPQELETNKNQIIATLKNYDIAIQRIAATVGPTVTLYEIVPAPGVRISRIKNLEDDIALSLAALGIRIIAPIPGKGTIGIEVPNVRKSVVSMKTLLASDKFQGNAFSLPIAIGKKIDNENFIVDLANMPHLLMAGATGQGKSVGLNAI